MSGDTRAPPLLAYAHLFSYAPEMPWRRPEPRPPVPLDPATARELARLLTERLDAVKTYGGSCHDAEAHAFLARLRELARRET